MPTNTNYATAASVVFAGGILKLVDGELFPILKDLQNAVDENTSGIIIVHIGGYISKEIEKIRQFCEKRSLFLLEDAAHAHGASLVIKWLEILVTLPLFRFFPLK